MKRLPPKTVFQDIPASDPGKVAALKIKIAAGEYRINPQHIAEKLMATDVFFNMYRSFRLSRPF
jgi:hypothetical protein